MIRKITLSFFLIINSYLLVAQDEASVKNLLDDYMNIVRTEDYTSSPVKELYSEKNSAFLLNVLNGFYADTIAKVRSKAYYLTYKAAYKNSNQELRNLAVYNLVQALKDKDSGNVGSVADWLTNFYANDFDEKSRDSLKNILHKQTVYLDKIISLIGFIGITDQNDYLKNNIKNGIYSSHKVIWATHLALARMGDVEEIDFCIDRVKMQVINDDVVYELVPDLIYIRNKDATDYLLSILNDDTKSCYSSNPENQQKITCAYRVMEYLAPIIKDFPIQTDQTGDLMADDYTEALRIVREWFKVHAKDYELIRDVY